MIPSSLATVRCSLPRVTRSDTHNFRSLVWPQSRRWEEEALVYNVGVDQSELTFRIIRVNVPRAR